MPSECFRFASDAAQAAAARSSPEYALKVLEAVGLTEGRESKGYSHLSPSELAALRVVISRKAAAFWVKDTPRSVMRGFKHDVITTGNPVRGRPIRLRGTEAEFVRQELEENVAQGLYTRGMSPWGLGPFRLRRLSAGVAVGPTLTIAL